MRNTTDYVIPTPESFGSACLTAIEGVISLFVTKESYVGKLGFLGKEMKLKTRPKGRSTTHCFLSGVKRNRSIGLRVQLRLYLNSYAHKIHVVEKK